jgi:hypothetical protein
MTIFGAITRELTNDGIVWRHSRDTVILNFAESIQDKIVQLSYALSL